MVLVPMIGIVAVATVIAFFVVGRSVNHSVALSWQAPTPVPGETVVTYNVYRSVSHGGPYVRIASGLTHLSYIDSFVTNGTTYYYVVTSVAANGHQSSFSAEVYAKIP